MKFSSFLAIFASLFGLGAAECFAFGVSWDNEDSAIGAMNYWCQKSPRGEPLNTGLTVQYTKGDKRTKCSNLMGEDKKPLGKRAEFSVEYLGDEPDTLERKDCVARLTDEIKACARGGSKQTGKWLFTADPNKGDC